MSQDKCSANSSCITTCIEVWRVSHDTGCATAKDNKHDGIPVVAYTCWDERRSRNMAEVGTGTCGTHMYILRGVPDSNIDHHFATSPGAYHLIPLRATGREVLVGNVP